VTPSFCLALPAEILLCKPLRAASKRKAGGQRPADLGLFLTEEGVPARSFYQNKDTLICTISQVVRTSKNLTGYRQNIQNLPGRYQISSPKFTVFRRIKSLFYLDFAALCEKYDIFATK
jgi:hypothetical protein